MNRKLAVLLLATLMIAAGTAPAFAATPRNTSTTALPGVQYFTMVGFIRAKTDVSLSVEVIHGNRFSQPLFGTIKTVAVNLGTTEIRAWTPFGCVPTAWSNVTVGDSVSINGYVDGTVFNASRVTIDVPLSCCTP